jgi:hypothetical protein
MRLVAATFLLSLAACCGRIHDVSAFVEPGKACPLADPYTDLIKPRCATSGCHDAATASNNLDLEDPAAPQKIVGRMAVGCSGHVLVRADRPGGFLFDKLNEKPDCGSQMPLDGNPLSDTERVCVAAWLEGGAQ